LGVLGGDPVVIVLALIGLPAREAVRTAVAAGLVPSLSGHGVAQKQEPPPGTSLPRGATVKLALDPPS
jgi:cell division protein FtsI (penicillin-binding protein 3)